MQRRPAPPIRRNAALSAPWLMVGTAAAGVAAYWYLSKYTSDLVSLM